jgi:hypothetical protein
MARSWSQDSWPRTATGQLLSFISEMGKPEIHENEGTQLAVKFINNHAPYISILSHTNDLTHVIVHFRTRHVFEAHQHKFQVSNIRIRVLEQPASPRHRKFKPLEAWHPYYLYSCTKALHIFADNIQIAFQTLPTNSLNWTLSLSYVRSRG